MYNFPENLLGGYRKFMTGRFSEQQARYKTLAESGQQPKTLIVACCDSRAAPETIFDSGPGELFVVRNVANMVPPFEPDGQYHSTSAALEFAVQSLRVKDIVVMGHGRCGGIKAVLDADAEPLSPGDFIGKWMNMLKPAAEQIAGNAIMTAAERQRAMEHVSIRNSIVNLRTFPCVQILEQRGKLQLHGAWFDISTGELWVMDPKSGDFSRPGT
ncbi:carbonate dehydratase [Rhizobium sp. Leaf371]|uniref:carbonic anhydrase n=1 Tax=unclassified Rhizobium TaxID=2613769 RepID=UPI0007140FEB|nr:MULTISPECIES: carbonic anhydrase [unclassified Rhizobium]KQS71999.1 carbonate dehydratase [Rhizobium sp. Leaf371]TCM54887.1 carbonic anhydrase [Rhizobium sp. PP-F2F-G48]